MTNEIATIIGNKEIIDINQDPVVCLDLFQLGVSARLVGRKKRRLGDVEFDVYVGPLSNGDAVAVLFNRISNHMNRKR